MKKTALISITLAMLAAACSNDESGKFGFIHEIPLSTNIEMDIDELKVNSGICNFSFDFLNEMAASGQGRNDDNNLCISPLSASLALAMLANTADDATTADINKLLGAENLATLNSTMNKLMRYLPSRGTGTQLELANSAWVHTSYPIAQAYEEALGRTFYAETNSKDFDDPATIDFVNGWCNEKSHGLIPSIINKLDSRNIFMLVNALYLCGKWSEPFDTADTRDMNFTGSDRSVTTAMMHSEEKSYYLESGLAEAAAISFDGDTRFVAMLPKGDVTAENLARTITLADYRALEMPLYTKLILDLPRFSIENNHKSVYNIFTDMGLSDNLTLDKMGHPSLSPEAMKTIQRTSIQLDEKGATMAAVTVIGDDLMAPGPEPTPEIKHLTFDRPFLFFVENMKTRTILMAGIINNL